MTIQGRGQSREDAQGAAGTALIAESIAFASVTPGFLRQWDELAKAPLHPNPFYTHATLTALLASDPAMRAGLHLLCLRTASGPDAGRLAGVLPTRSCGVRVGWRRGIANYTSPYLPCGSPLIARNAPSGWAQSLLAALIADGRPAILRHLPLDGPVGDAISVALQASGLPWRALDPFARPIATKAQSYDAFARRAYGRSRRKGLRRLRKALSMGASLSVTSGTDPAAFADAVEAYLALEAAGWKGAAGTALAQKQETRAMLTQLFHPDLPAGTRRVDRLVRDGRTIALSMSLVQDGTAFLWKTAYDEDFRRLAPGIVLEDAIVQALHAEPELCALDSCTLAASPLQDLYDERLPIADLVIAPGRWGDALIAAERGRRTLRHRVAGWLRRRRG